MIMYFNPFDICLARSISGASALLLIANLITSRENPNINNAIAITIITPIIPKTIPESKLRDNFVMLVIPVNTSTTPIRRPNTK